MFEPCGQTGKCIFPDSPSGIGRSGYWAAILGTWWPGEGRVGRFCSGALDINAFLMLWGACAPHTPRLAAGRGLQLPLGRSDQGFALLAGDIPHGVSGHSQLRRTPAGVADLEGDWMSRQRGQEFPDQPVEPPAGLSVSHAGLDLCSPSHTPPVPSASVVLLVLLGTASDPRGLLCHLLSGVTPSASRHPESRILKLAAPVPRADQRL